MRLNNISTFSSDITTSTNLNDVNTVVIPPEEIFQSCYESEEFIKFQYTVDDLLLAASTASTVFNFLVVFCAFKLFKRSGDTMHLFIINMTLGDLVLTVFSLPNEFLMRKHAFLRHIHLCALIHFCNWLGLAVSGLSLTLLNIDKLIYFRWPLRYDQTMSKRRAAVLCFFIWGVSFGFVSYVWIFNIVYATSDCMLQMSDLKKYYYEIFMIMFCVLPVTSSLFLSTYLFRLTRQKRNAPSRSDGEQVDIRTFKNKVRSLVFIFATTAWTSFSLLPYRIFNICRIHLFDWNSFECEQRVIMNWLAWLLIYLLTLNPINPLPLEMILELIISRVWIRAILATEISAGSLHKHAISLIRLISGLVNTDVSPTLCNVIINPLITSIIYAPYRMTLKKLLINIPIGNRLQYTYRGDTTETSYLSVRRTRARCDATGGASRAQSHELTRLNNIRGGGRKTSASAVINSAEKSFSIVEQEKFDADRHSNAPYRNPNSTVSFSADNGVASRSRRRINSADPDLEIGDENKRKNSMKCNENERKMTGTIDAANPPDARPSSKVADLMEAEDDGDKTSMESGFVKISNDSQTRSNSEIPQNLQVIMARRNAIVDGEMPNIQEHFADGLSCQSATLRSEESGFLQDHQNPLRSSNDSSGSRKASQLAILPQAKRVSAEAYDNASMSYIDDSTSEVLSPSPERAKKIWPLLLSGDVPPASAIGAKPATNRNAKKHKPTFSIPKFF